MDLQHSEKPKRKRKSRGRGLRKTTGCLTCRRRHLGCDEGSPQCGPCTRSKQICVYGPSSSGPSTAETTVASTPAEFPETSPALGLEDGNSWGVLIHQQQRPTLPRGSIDESDPLDHERTQAASGLLHLNATSVYDEPSQPPEPVYAASIRATSTDATYTAETPPDAAFSRWFGLLVKDADYDAGEAIDDFLEPRPLNPAGDQSLCVAPSNLQEGRYFSRENRRTRIDRLSIASSSYAGSPVLQHSSRALGKPLWRGSEPSRLLAHEQQIFENFIRNVSSWIDLFDPTRCFSIFVPHLAMHDAGLMNAVLALSARHLSLSPNSTEEQRDRNIGLQYYYQTLHYLQKAMQYDSYTTSLELLATALIVSTYEMLDDFGSGWERHLKGVFWIQRSQVIQGESGGLKAAVWWAWMRQDIWAAFRERRKTLSFWTPTKPYTVLDPHELASRSIWLFARAVDYFSVEAIKAGETDLQARIEKANSVIEMLEEWQMNLTIEFMPVPVGSSLPSDVFAPIWIHPPAFANSIQLNCAARILLLLHRPSLGGRRGFMEQQQLLIKSVNTICGIAMTLVDDASSLMSSQCLFIAGMCVQDPRQREVLLSLLDMCQRRTGWPTRSLSVDLRTEWDVSMIS